MAFLLFLLNFYRFFSSYRQLSVQNDYNFLSSYLEKNYSVYFILFPLILIHPLFPTTGALITCKNSLFLLEFSLATMQRGRQEIFEEYHFKLSL